MVIFKDDVYELLLVASAVAIADMGSGEIYFVSRELERMFGYDAIANELISVNIDILLPEQYREGHQKHRKEFASNPSPRARPMGRGMQLQGRRRDGSLFPVQIMLHPRRFSGLLCVAAIVTDMTPLTVTVPHEAKS